MNTTRILAVFGVALSVAACGGEEAAAGSGIGATAAAEAPAVAPAAEVPTGNVIEVRMVTDDKGNYFDPAEVTARPGDVIRFTLASGVHNVSFPSDKNPGAAGLPQPSPFFQQPGQTHDVPVSFAPGTYQFQCDPHVALGMTGKLTVQ